MSSDASPPGSPPDIPIPTGRPDSPSSSDYSPIEELSFDFTFDAEGKYVRLAKSVHSSPPTPQDSEQELEPDEYEEPLSPEEKPISPVSSNSPALRGGLFRSESSHPTERPLNPPSTTSRSYYRTTNTPASNAAPLRQALTLTTGSTRIDRPQRVTLEEAREQEERNRKQIEEIKAKMEEELQRGRTESKETVFSDDERPPGNASRGHHPTGETPHLGSSRSLSSRLAGSSSQSSSARVRGMSNSGTLGSSSSHPAEPPTSQREHDRERPDPRQVKPSQNRSGKLHKPSGSIRTTTRSASMAGWEHSPEVDSVEGEGYHEGGGYDNYPGQREWDDDIDRGIFCRYF